MHYVGIEMSNKTHIHTHTQKERKTRKDEGEEISKKKDGKGKHTGTQKLPSSTGRNNLHAIPAMTRNTLHVQKLVSLFKPARGSQARSSGGNLAPANASASALTHI